MALLRLNNFSERDLDLTLSYGAGLMLNQKLNSSHYVANGYVCQKPECGIITMAVDNRGTTDVPRWYYSFMIRGVRYFGSILEARTKAEASKAEAMKRLEVYEGRYGKEPGVKDFCEFIDQVYMEYAKNNKVTWKHDLFRSETLKEHFCGLRFRDITPRSVEKFIPGRLNSDSRRKSKRSAVSVHKEFVFSHQSSTWQCGKTLQ